MATSQIDKSGGALGGKGLAIAGIIVGFFVVGVTIIIIAVIISVASTCHTGANGHLTCH